MSGLLREFHESCQFLMYPKQGKMFPGCLILKEPNTNLGVAKLKVLGRSCS